MCINDVMHTHTHTHTHTHLRAYFVHDLIHMLRFRACAYARPPTPTISPLFVQKSGDACHELGAHVTCFIDGGGVGGRERQREREIIRKTCEMIRVGGKEEERD